ncbi:MAG: preprotein translocase subunit SecE [Thermofilum sp.]
MGLDMPRLLEDIIRVVKLATKPTAEEYKLSLKVILAGFSLLGALGFFFQLVGSMLEIESVHSVPSELSLIIGVVALVAILALGLYLRSKSEI